MLVMLLIIYINIPSDGYYSNDDRIVSYKNDLYNFHNADSLIIAVEKDAPGVFLYNSVYYGYFNAIFREYAYSIGKVLKIVTCDSQRDLIKLLNTDSVAFGITISSKDGISDQTKRFFIPEISDSSRYVILGNRGNKIKNKLSVDELLDSSKVIYKRGSKEIDFLSAKSYDYLRDTSSARFLNTTDYVSLVRNGDYDFLICKEEESFFYCYNYKNIIKTHQLDQWVFSIVLTNNRNRTLFREFSRWLKEFKENEIYEDIVNYYHNDKYLKNFLEDGFLNPVRSISHFDDIFRNKAKKTPFNWKFLAAIAYTESKFNPLERSSSGAVGIMQVTPRSGRYWGAESEDELRQPKINISISIKILLDNMRLLKINSNKLSTDDIKIILASYNAGYGHVSDAARLAKKHGENSKSWDVIKKYLQLKSNKKYYQQKDIVHSGSFHSSETEKFVDNVMTKYNEYLNSSVK